MGFFSNVFDKVGGALVGGLFDIGSTALGNSSAKQEAQLNRDWQENLSNTAVQRRVADMKKAGINPLLAVNSASAGASTPSGAVADVKKVDPAFIQAMASAFTAKKQGEVADAQRRNIEADTRNKDVDTISKQQYNSLHEIRQEILSAERDLKKEGILNARTERMLAEAKTVEIAENILKSEAERLGINAKTAEIKRYLELMDIEIEMAKRERDSWTTSGFARGWDYLFDKAEQVGRIGSVVTDALIPWAENRASVSSFNGGYSAKSIRRFF